MFTVFTVQPLRDRGQTLFEDAVFCGVSTSLLLPLWDVDEPVPLWGLVPDAPSSVSEWLLLPHCLAVLIMLQASCVFKYTLKKYFPVSSTFSAKWLVSIT